MKRILSVVLSIIPVYVIAEPINCQVPTYLKNGFNMQAYQQCRTAMINQCPGAGEDDPFDITDPNDPTILCMNKVSNEKPSCAQTQELGLYPNDVIYSQNGFTVLQLTRGEERYTSYSIIPPVPYSCIIYTDEIPPNAMKPFAKKHHFQKDAAAINAFENLDFNYSYGTLQYKITNGKVQSIFVPLCIAADFGMLCDPDIPPFVANFQFAKDGKPLGVTLQDASNS